MVNGYAVTTDMPGSVLRGLLSPLFGLLALVLVTPGVYGTIYSFNAITNAGNITQESLWLTAVGTVPIATIDFETGYSNGQDVTGQALSDPAYGGSVTLTSISPSYNAITVTGTISGSYPVGSYALSLDEGRTSVLHMTFSNPTYAFSFYGIDHGALQLTLTFDDSTTAVLSPDTTISAGSSAEFYGVYVDDGRLISSVDFGAQPTADAFWGLDNIAYQVPEPSSVALMGLTGLVLLRGRRRKA